MRTRERLYLEIFCREIRQRPSWYISLERLRQRERERWERVSRAFMIYSAIYSGITKLLSFAVIDTSHLRKKTSQIRPFHTPSGDSTWTVASNGLQLFGSSHHATSDIRWTFARVFLWNFIASGPAGDHCPSIFSSLYWVQMPGHLKTANCS